MAAHNEFEIEFQRKYVEIFVTAEKLGFNSEWLIYRDDNDINRGGCKKKSSKNTVKLFYVLLGFLFLLLSRLILNGDVHIHALSYPITEFTLGISDSLNISLINFKGNQCAFNLPSFLTSLLNPPANCSMCRGLRTVEKVKNLSKEKFEQLYAYTGRPVIVTDAMINWTATEKFGFEFFANLYNNLASNDSLDCQFFPYQTKFQNLIEVFKSDPHQNNFVSSCEPWYIGWGNCDSNIAEILRQHYSTPYFIPEGSQLSGIDWIFMGSPGYGAHMHIDRVGNPSWQAQVKGSKLWTLIPPSECFYECHQDVKAVVKKGEMIILDTDQWHHSTLIIGDETSITIGSEYD